MTERGRYHGGLVIFDPHRKVLERFTRIVAATLEDYGHPVERCTYSDGVSARVTATHYAITLGLTQGAAQPGDDGGIGFGRLNPTRRKRNGALERHWRIQLDIYAADPTRDDPDISELLLVVMLYRMVGRSDTRLVEWLSPETTMTAEQFTDAFRNISPALINSRGAVNDVENPHFAPVDDMMIDLSRTGLANSGGAVQASDQQAGGEFEDADDDIPSDVQRLAIWGMTGMTAFLSAPVALSLAAVNLARGEDLRLNTHVLSLTGLLVTLQSTGALASAMSRIFT